jgi:FG-GAP repeat
VVGAYYRGAAYLYQKDATGTWQFVKKLVASDRARDDYFGGSVAISGDTVVVGAYGDDIDQGSAYIFERDQGGANTWGQVKKLLASDGAEDDSFGGLVAISGDTVVVGAMFDDIGTNINQGSAYLFQRDKGGANTWGRVKKLLASDRAEGDYFGSSVAISGDTVVVGAFMDNVGTNIGQGSAYIY